MDQHRDECLQVQLISTCVHSSDFCVFSQCLMVGLQGSFTQSSSTMMDDDFPSGVVKCGGYRYEDGTRFIGDWNKKGQKHGLGHYLLPDGSRYDGAFTNGFCSGLGVLKFADGAK